MTFTQKITGTGQKDIERIMRDDRSQESEPKVNKRKEKADHRHFKASEPHGVNIITGVSDPPDDRSDDAGDQRASKYFLPPTDGEHPKSGFFKQTRITAHRQCRNEWPIGRGKLGFPGMFRPYTPESVADFIKHRLQADQNNGDHLPEEDFVKDAAV